MPPACSLHNVQTHISNYVLGRVAGWPGGAFRLNVPRCLLALTAFPLSSLLHHRPRPVSPSPPKDSGFFLSPVCPPNPHPISRQILPAPPVKHTPDPALSTPMPPTPPPSPSPARVPAGTSCTPPAPVRDPIDCSPIAPRVLMGNQSVHVCPPTPREAAALTVPGASPIPPAHQALMPHPPPQPRRLPASPRAGRFPPTSEPLPSLSPLPQMLSY